LPLHHRRLPSAHVSDACRRAGFSNAHLAPRSHRTDFLQCKRQYSSHPSSCKRFRHRRKWPPIRCAKYHQNGQSARRDGCDRCVFDQQFCNLSFLACIGSYLLMPGKDRRRTPYHWCRFHTEVGRNVSIGRWRDCPVRDVRSRSVRDSSLVSEASRKKRHPAVDVPP